MMGQLEWPPRGRLASRVVVIPVEEDEPHIKLGRRVNRVARAVQEALPFARFPLR